MMQQFYLQADCDDPQDLVPVLQAMTGARDIRLSKQDYDADLGEPAAVNIEWYRRPGRFGLDVKIWGENIRPGDTEARFARAFAREMGRAALFSDCSAFPFSWFMANPDGAIWYVVTRIGDEDIMDLQNDDPSDPDHFIPQLFFRAEDALPDTVPKQESASCDRASDGKLCEIFAMPCPKMRNAQRPPGEGQIPPQTV